MNVDHVCDGEPEVSCNKCLLKRERAENAVLRAEVERLKSLVSTVAFSDAKVSASLYDQLQTASLQNRLLKESIWKHLHIKHERTVCPISVGTPERCCEIIMKDAGLNPTNGEFVEKRFCECDPLTVRGGTGKCDICGKDRTQQGL